MKRLILMFGVLWLLVGCGADALEDDLGLGGVTPEAVVESFFENLNAALADPTLSDPTTRRDWANRLASYFAPGERADQRIAIREMLDGFANSNLRPAHGSRSEVSISYDRTRVVRSDSSSALVNLVNAVITVRWRDASGEIVLERSDSLLRLIGRDERGLPVIRVDGRWYLTEAG